MKIKKIKNKKYKKNKFEKPKHLHELIGLMFFAFGVLLFFSLYFENTIGIFGNIIKSLSLGMLGISVFLVPPIIILYSVFLIFKKNVNLKFLYLITFLLLVSGINETLNYNNFDHENYTFLKNLLFFYNSGKEFKGGGILGGFLSMPFLFIFQYVGTLIILSTFLLINLLLLTKLSIANIFAKTNSTLRKIFGNLKQICIFKTKENNKSKENNKIKPNKVQKTITKENLKKENIDIDLISFGNELNVDINIKEEKKKKTKEKVDASLIIKEIEECEKNDVDYLYPSIELLNDNTEKNMNIKELKSIAIEEASKLEQTLRSFGVEAKVINICRGPAVTRYELQPSVGVKVSKIVSLADDISLNLASFGIRIEAPIPGKAAVGIEVPNKDVTPIFLKEVIESSEFINYSSKISFALGKDISGQNIIADIAKMPHVLIAGATGSGKSVCINSIIISLLYKSSPNEVKLLMIDPKVVELGIYNGIPHLLIPVVTDPKKAAGALNWAVQEMINRYKLFAEKGVRDIKGYNVLMKELEEEGVLPQIVIIIDELADLMMVASKDVEDSICRLAQMARAAGMHLVIATQRPSVDVITGIIKANIPSRISFAVTSQIDSRTILDMPGAEKLLGRGDMLFYPVGQSKPIRVKGAFVSDKEVEKVVEFVKEQGSADYNNEIIDEINSDKKLSKNDEEECDEFLSQAIELIIDSEQASVSYIQRKFKVGYARAARIIDQMEKRGIVGPSEGSKPRQILMTKQQLIDLKMTELIS